MANQRQIPGGPFIVENGNRQVAVPGYGFLVEVATLQGATSYTITGPTSGVNNEVSETFTANANGETSAIITVSDNGAGGVFSPSNTFAAQGGTFTYTPSTTGNVTLSFTNNGGLSNPSNITYVVTALPTGTITSQPVPDGQNQRFVGTTTDATTGTYSLVGADGGESVGPLNFDIVNDAFDFTHVGLKPGSYSPTLTVSGPGGTAVVSGTSAFTISSVGGGGSVASRTVTVKLLRANLQPVPYGTILKYALFDEITPDLFQAPVQRGLVSVSDAAGTTSITVTNSAKQVGQVLWLIITDSDGVPATKHKAFSGPVIIN